MRKLITALLCVITISCIAQTKYIDSLKTSLFTEKKDTSRFQIFLNLSYAFSNLSLDSSLSFAQQALALPRQSAFIKGEARSLEKIGYDYASLGNYPKSLQLELDALKKAETINDSDLVASVYDAIANTYSMPNDMRTSAGYDLKAFDMVRSSRNKREFTIVLMNIGDTYEKLNILDSARHFTNWAYEMALQLNDPDFIGNTLDNLGNISLKMHQDAIAMDYYRADLPYLKSVNDNEALCETYLNMANYLKHGATMIHVLIMQSTL